MYNQSEVEQAITAILGDKDMIDEDLPSPTPVVQDQVPEESSKNLCFDLNQNDISCPLQQDLPRRSSESPSSLDRNSPSILDPSSSPPITRKRENVCDSEMVTTSKRLATTEASLDFQLSIDESTPEQHTQNNHQHPELTYPPPSPINVEADSQPQTQRVSYSTMREDVEFWSSYLGKIIP